MDKNVTEKRTNPQEILWRFLQENQIACEQATIFEDEARMQAPKDPRVRDGMWTKEQALHDLLTNRLRDYVEDNEFIREQAGLNPEDLAEIDYADLAKRWLNQR